jgi:gas vesicle protein
MEVFHCRCSWHAIGLFVGAAIGGTMGLLYAPTTGKETRRLVASTMHHATDEAHELAAHVRHFVDEKAHVFKSIEMPTRAEKEKQLHHNTLGIGLLTGLLIGGIVALLYAPKSGKETRKLLRDKAEETSHEAVEFAEQAKDFAVEEVRKVKAAAEAVKHEVETQHN